jgi:predicted transposase YbfD/YdcC
MARISNCFSVRRIVTAQGITTDETGYYISSKDATAKELLEISRAHWNIESMHWMLDADFSEDECELKSENGQKTLNIFRKLALFAHRQYMKTQAKKRSIKSNLLRCLISDKVLNDVIQCLFNDYNEFALSAQM